MSDTPGPQDDLDRLRTLHAMGDLTDEEFAAAEKRLQSQGPGSAASLTTKFEAIQRGETPYQAPAPAVDPTTYEPQVVAAAATAKKGPPVLLIAIVAVAVIVLVVAALLV